MGKLLNSAFRKIVADIIGKGHGRGRGVKKRAAWRQAVESIQLAELTPAKVQQWKLSFVAKPTMILSSSGPPGFQRIRFSPAGKIVVYTKRHEVARGCQLI